MAASRRAYSLGRLCLVTLAALSIILAVHGQSRAESGSSSVVTHGEFAAVLVQELGWRTGLPAEPKPADYLAVLSGNRTFRFEAEDTYNAEGDSVSVRQFPLHGPFTGTGWLSGTAEPTMVRLTIFIPRGGEYLLTVVSRGDGQRWKAGDRELSVSAGGSLRETEAGMVSLRGGSQEISVLLPPEGGVDSFTLTAAGDHPAIEPLGGWRMDAPLTWSEYAETIAAALDLEKGFASSAAAPQIAGFHSVKPLPASAVVTSADYLGRHVSPAWVRAGVEGASLELPLTVPATGVYGVRVRLLGTRITTELDGKRVLWEGKPYLEWYDLGVFRLAKGSHALKVQLPPLGGADAVELTARASSPADYLAAVGLGNIKPTATVTRGELETRLRKDLSRITPSR
uniref:Uncharacterized protein n=1 Tax=Geobacter metallireducens TaxID=28232 RepID=A0A831U2T9_GEOME